MIHAPGNPDAPAPRLLGVVSSRMAEGTPTLVVSSGSARGGAAWEDLLAEWRHRQGARVLVMSALGVHPDAKAPRLRELWAIEERVRACGLPALVLRLAPLVGPESPLWLRLRSRPGLRGCGDLFLNPVVESDAVRTIEHLLGGTGGWSGWFEVAGDEVLTLGELAALARETPLLARGAGAWEPGPEEMSEHRLGDSGSWREQLGIVPRRVTEEVGRWR